MRALDIKSFADHIAGSKVADDSIWKKELSTISDMDIQLFYARSAPAGVRRMAEQAIDALQSELLLEAIEGRLDSSQLRIIGHEVPIERLTAEEFVSRLLQLSVIRRQATLYALVTKQEPEKVAAMEWVSMGRQGQPPGLPREIISARSAVRHMKLPYVFWEFATKTIAAPLLHLKESAEEAFRAEWPVVQEQWTEMIWISPRADSHSLMSLVGEVKAGRL